VLLRDLQRDFGTAIVMITHDLGVVAGLCDSVLVLYGGRIMEQGSAESIFYQPTHPYTVGLLGAVPRLEQEDQALVAIPGAPPNMARLPPGCPFSERCALADALCTSTMPALLPCILPAISPAISPANSSAAIAGTPLALPSEPFNSVVEVLRACHRSPGEVQQVLQQVQR
jgi:oligopeptide/dipeptide ABC transporter ATP-binding protein